MQPESQRRGRERRGGWGGKEGRGAAKRWGFARIPQPRRIPVAPRALRVAVGSPPPKPGDGGERCPSAAGSGKSVPNPPQPQPQPPPPGPIPRRRPRGPPGEVISSTWNCQRGEGRPGAVHRAPELRAEGIYGCVLSAACSFLPLFPPLPSLFFWSQCTKRRWDSSRLRANGG